MKKRRPTLQTITFECPRCGYRQKGYFAVCPTQGCDDAKWKEFVAAARARSGESR
jgi:hypothetical protein